MSSSRRTTGDINILAMLDGQASGRRPRVLPAALRYGAAGVLVCSLVATLVWLVQDDAPARDGGKGYAAQASLHAGAAGPGAGPAGATSLRDTQPASTHEVELVVTQRDDLFPARDSMPASVPGKGTAPAAETSSSTAPGRVFPPLPLQMPAPATTAPAHAAADGHATTHTTAQAAPPARTPTGPQKAPARRLSLARTAATTSHPKRGAAASGTMSPSTVDRDVAVISAILQHTATHSEAADTAPAPGCPDKSCAIRMPSRQ